MVAAKDEQDDPRPTGTSVRKKRPQRAPTTHVANALRSAYEETVRESVPDEFMDLLGKLA